MTALRVADEANDPVQRAWAVLGTVPDPEIPVLSVVDLGVVRRVAQPADGGLEVDVSPTYSGCPAGAVIRADIEQALRAAGFAPVVVREVLSPAWTTDWISEHGHEQLRRYGIAPPRREVRVSCPRCGSQATELLSEFSSTPCKALHRCSACLEPFDRFKCL